MIVAAVDPGKQGGIAVFNQDLSIHSLYVMPIKKNNKVNLLQLFSIFKTLVEDGLEKCYVEDVHSIPGASAKSSWGFARNVSAVFDVLELLEVEVVLIDPKAWLGGLGLKVTPEVRKPSLGWVSSRYVGRWPEEVELLTRDGVSDSICIGLWGIQSEK